MQIMFILFFALFENNRGRNRLRTQFDLTALWNRGLPAHARVTHKVLWPLLLLPLILVNQLVTPHPIWVVLLVTLASLYGVGIYWARQQARAVTLSRRRVGTILVAGDQLEEEFVITNASIFPLLWGELHDHSTLPGYQPGRVVGCGANASYRWNANAECRQRGVYRLGPHQLVLGDPFGLFGLTLDFAQQDTVLIYPRVLHLPAVPLPQGNQSDGARRQRPLWGAQPSASVRDYQPTDSLRYVHWPRTAHRGELMVKELESEPSGAIWVMVDLQGSVHGVAEQANGVAPENTTANTTANTLEAGIIVAASLSADLLQADSQRAVGLFTISGPRVLPFDLESAATNNTAHPSGDEAVTVAPQRGPAQLWTILAALAPVTPTTVSLYDLLRTAATTIGQRTTIIVVTTPTTGEMPTWLPELVQLQRRGVNSTVLLVIREDQQAAADVLAGMLVRQGIGAQSIPAALRLPPALTFRRKRRVIRNTPTGGVVTYEVEEEVG